MFQICSAAEPLFNAIVEAEVFAEPTLPRFASLVIGLILSMGRHTVSHALVPIQPLLKGHWSNYHRLYSSAKFSFWLLAAVLIRQVVALLPRDAAIELVADDTVDGKGGEHVWAKSAHRDPTRSTRSRPQIRYGHKWLVMCVLIHLKGWDRPWALPILCGLCIPRRVGLEINRRQKTASQLARQMLIRLMRWLPDRKFILTGDYQVITHETVVFARRHSNRVTVIGRLRGDANLYAPPVNHNRPEHAGKIKKGKKLPSPAKQVTHLKVIEQEVGWYGNSRRRVSCVTAQALWYDPRLHDSPPIRWVAVLGNPKQKMETDYFFCSDTAATAGWIIERYARRWNIEVTFEESRALLGLETTRHWCRQSVLRVTPILLGLFSVVTLIWNELPATRRWVVSTATPCYRKTQPTFADALAAVRRELWQTTILQHRGKTRCFSSLPGRLRKTLLWHLSAAA